MSPRGYVKIHVPLPRPVVAHRQALRTALLVAAAGAPLLALVAAAFIPEWRARRYLLFYLAPFAAAMALWARERLLHPGTRATLALDGLAVLLSAARLGVAALPFSGHMLFFVYSGLTVRSRGYRVLAGVLAVETTWFKLVVWEDPVTWGGGIALGLVLAALHRAQDR